MSRRSTATPLPLRNSAGMNTAAAHRARCNRLYTAAALSVATRSTSADIDMVQEMRAMEQRSSAGVDGCVRCSRGRCRRRRGWRNEGEGETDKGPYINLNSCEEVPGSS
uniref:Uncharacterized protein n=1 Tax=Oryza meridionalis TaxID=40149 RepID=A0A0E0DBT5_9ORYZ